MEKIDLQSIPRWEKVIWLLIALFLIIAFSVFWIYGFSHLPFPV
jgi:uncharacterized SAM-binding protein YcdF (DUF218 family)